MSSVKRHFKEACSCRPVGVQNKVLTLFRDLQQNIEGKVEFMTSVHALFY